MNPTLKDGERVFARKISWYNRNEIINKIVVFYFPFGNYGEFIVKNKDNLFIKRCVAGPGDSVVINYQKSDKKDKAAPIFYNDVVTNYDSHTDNLMKMSPIYIPQKGDTLFLGDKKSYLYDKIINYELQNGSSNTDSTYYVFQRNYYFMVGDNLKYSYDSRIWGFVPEEFVIYYVKR